VAGSGGNTDSGAPLTLAVTLPGINPNGSATAAITGGADLEVDSSLHMRMLESYAAPPHGGNQADYVTWALAVTGVTLAWCAPQGLGPGTVVVYFMMDAAEPAHGGFPQGTNGVAVLETRDVAATGDQLAVANAIFPLRPVTALVYAVAPVAQPQAFTLAGLASVSTAQQGQVSAALAGLFLLKDSPLATVSIEQSDVTAAVSAIGGLPSFAVTTPSSWPITSAAGSLFTLGTVSFA
jgi:uncharacterized phage protein gp47/JayE